MSKTKPDKNPIAPRISNRDSFSFLKIFTKKYAISKNRTAALEFGLLHPARIPEKRYKIEKGILRL
ncbi:hypothetical protein AGMMS50230_20180 [Spirochaetia bacterium]|nr:hypothetical protein AGMMS50230_20180 [Spirochaetia bacterium]